MSHDEKILKEAQQIALEVEKLKWLSRNHKGTRLPDFDALAGLIPEDDEYYAPMQSAHYTKECGMLVYTHVNKKTKQEHPLGIYCDTLEEIVLEGIDMDVDEKNSEPGQTRFIYKCVVSECDKECLLKQYQ